MHPVHRPSSFTSRLAGALLAGLCYAGPLSADTYTWNGSASGLWGTTANWSGILNIPLTNDEAVFPAAGSTKSMNNNIASGLAVHRLTFSGSGYSLNGSGISLSSTLGVPLLRTTHTSGSTSINVAVTLAEVATVSTVSGGTLTIAGGIATGGHTVTLDSDGTIQVQSAISGSGGVTLAGAGTVTYSAAQSYSGATALNSGTLNLSTGATMASTITVAAGATLSGIGTAAGVTTSGTISPAGSGFGRLTATGAVTFNNVSTAILALELGTANTAGTTYDQLTAAGAITINAASVLQLVPTGTFTPARFDSYRLLDNTSASPIIGTFSGLPDNGTVDVGNRRLRISYTGGNGNDIVATVINAPPTISNITDRTINEDASTGSIALTVGDLETVVGSLVMSGSSSNTTLVPNANIVFGGSGANRAVTITPAANQSGAATITLTVNDGTTTTSDTFILTVSPVNDLPTITNVTDLAINEDVSTGPISFTVGDVETAAGSLVMSGSSSNTTLVPNANIVFGGSEANRTVTVTPVANQSGAATITLTVSDGTATAIDTFVLTVNPVNDPPVISDITDQSGSVGLLSPSLAFTVQDIESPGSLTVTALSSNQAVVADAAISLGGSGGSRILSFTPTGPGVATITVNVSDGTTTASDTFIVTVAGEFVWDGGGADDSTATPANWAGDLAPPLPNGVSELVFSGSTRLTPFFATSYTLDKISFAPTAGAFVLNGASLQMRAGGVENSAAHLVTINNPLNFAGAASSGIAAGAGGLQLNGPLTFPSSTLTLTGPGPVTFGPDADFTLGLNRTLAVATDTNIEAQIAVTLGLAGQIRVAVGKHLRLRQGGALSSGTSPSGNAADTLALEPGAQLSLTSGSVISLPDNVVTLDGHSVNVTDSTFGMHTLILNNGASLTATRSLLRSYFRIGAAPVPGDPFNSDVGGQFIIGANGSGTLTLNQSQCDGFSNSYLFQIGVGPDGLLTLDNASTATCRALESSGRITLAGGSNLVIESSDSGVVEFTGGTVVIGAGCELRSETLVTGTPAASGTGTLRLNRAYQAVPRIDILPPPPQGTAAFAPACNLVLGPQHVLTLNIGGTIPGTQFDRLACNGPGSPNFIRAGTLRVSLVNGFVPAAGQSFDLFDFDPARTTGDFSTIELPALPVGLVWDDSLFATQGILRVNPPTAIQEWRFLHFGTHLNSGNAANLFDFDKDGVANLLEFAFSLNPKTPDSQLLPAAFPDNGDLVIGFSRPAGVSGITYFAESSSTLTPGEWTPVPNLGFGALHLYRLPMSPAPRRFLRLGVTSP